MKVYLDNAATTPLDPSVAEAMYGVMCNNFGNPSSTHTYGREVKTIIENARKTIAKLINCTPAEVFFTSGGTEADNMAIVRAVHDLGVRHIITSSIEHHAVLHTVEQMHQNHEVEMHLVQLDAQGNVDLTHLESLLEAHQNVLVTLMHANNEIGTLINLERIGELCKKHTAYFHSDTVQTMGHYVHDTQKLNAHFLTCAAHKLHGPKGIGFLYINHTVKIKPFIYGGAQERNMRGGTENVYGIVGLAKALALCYEEMAHHQQHIQHLKDTLRKGILDIFPEAKVNGNTASEGSLYTVLNMSLPLPDHKEMLLFSLDIAGIAVSGGSACSSGSNVGSHVLKGINAPQQWPAVRFSFSKMNTLKDIEFVLETLKNLAVVKV